MFAALLACSCPSFDEMEVVAADTSATYERVATVRRALEDFAAWTGDDGVCVPEIRLQEDLPEPAEMDEAWETAGQYEGDHNPIRVDADSGGLRRTTFHELCHATDRREGHRDAVAWPEVADRSWYHGLDGLDAVGEDFANACEKWTFQAALDAATDAACGTAPVFDAPADYLDEVVFPDALRAAWSDAPYSYTETATPWEGLPYGVIPFDARVVDGEVLLLVWDDTGVYVTAFDTTLTEWRWETRIAQGVLPRSLTFVNADLGAYVALGLYGEPGEIVEIDRTGTARAVETGAEWVGNPMAVADGILYAAQNDTLVASTLDGEPVALDPPEELFARPLDVGALWPEAHGVGFYVAEGLGRYNADDNSWSVEPAIGEVLTRVDVGDGRALIQVSGAPGRWFVYEDGAYGILGDPCESSPDIGNVRIQFGVEGRLAWFDWESSEEGDIFAFQQATLAPS